MSPSQAMRSARKPSGGPQAQAGNGQAGGGGGRGKQRSGRAHRDDPLAVACADRLAGAGPMTLACAGGMTCDDAMACAFCMACDASRFATPSGALRRPPEWPAPVAWHATTPLHAGHRPEADGL